MNEVLEILEALDVNSRRIECRFETMRIRRGWRIGPSRWSLRVGQVASESSDNLWS